MAVADYAFFNETVNPMGGGVAAGTTLNPGNNITTVGTLVTPFNILEFTNELALHAGPLPLSLQFRIRDKHTVQPARRQLHTEWRT